MRRGLRFIALIREDLKVLLLQRQHFLRSYFTTLSDGPAAPESNSRHDSPMLNQLSHRWAVFSVVIQKRSLKTRCKHLTPRVGIPMFWRSSKISFVEFSDVWFTANTADHGLSGMMLLGWQYSLSKPNILLQLPIKPESDSRSSSATLLGIGISLSTAAGSREEDTTAA